MIRRIRMAKALNLGNPIYSKHFNIFNSGSRAIKWFEAGTASKIAEPVKFSKEESLIMGVAHLIPDVKMYPEQTYNKILQLKDLPHSENVKEVNFKVKANDLKYNDIGRNVKTGYTWKKTGISVYSWRRRYTYGTWHKQYMDKKSAAALKYHDNRILNQPANTLNLMILDKYLLDDKMSVMDLIYGKTDKTILDNITRTVNDYRQDTYMKHEKRDWTKFERFVDYSYSNPLKLSHYMNRQYTYAYGITIKGKPSIRSISLGYTYSQTKRIPCGVGHSACNKYRAMGQSFYYDDVVWDSTREKDVVILKGAKFKKTNDSFTELNITNCNLETNNYNSNQQHYYHHSKKILSSWYNFSTIKESYTYSEQISPSFREKFHTQKRYLESTEFDIKEEDKYDKVGTMLDDGADEYLNEFNLMLEKTDMSNINCTVLTSLLLSRFEEYSVTNRSALFKDEGLSNEEFVLYKHLEEDMSHIVPEISPAGIEILLKIVKHTILEQVTYLKPYVMGPGKTQVSLFSVEDSDTLQYWIVKLYSYCKRVNLQDKDFFPYFVPHLKDKEGNDIESIRMDVSRGKNCEYLIPVMPMESYSFKSIDKDELMSSFDKYMQILRPLITKMSKDKIEVIDYCYPVLSISKHLFPEFHKSFYKDEIPKFEDSLDIYVKVDVLARLMKFIDQELLTNTEHDYNPSNFRRRSMLKKLDLWEDSKHLDFSKTVLPGMAVDEKSGAVTYDIVDGDSIKKLKTISIGDKLRMLQNATDLLSNIDIVKDDKVYKNLYSLYILPVVKSLKRDNLVTEEQFTTRLEDMMKLKHTLDYMRDVKLTFLRKRKATLIQLFTAQESTLRKVLEDDKLAQDNFFNSISDVNINVDDLVLTDSRNYDKKDFENIEDIEIQLEKKKERNIFQSKFGVGGIAALSTGMAAGLVIKLLKKGKK